MTEALLQVDEAGAGRGREGLAGVAQVVEGDGQPDLVAGAYKRLIYRVAADLLSIAVRYEVARPSVFAGMLP